MIPHAVFLDIDGTLLRERGVVSQKDIDAISRARKAGHFVFINTGRSFANSISSITDKIDFDGIICGVGAYISIHGKLIKHETLPSSLCTEIIDLFLRKKRLCWLEGERKILFLSDDKARETDTWRRINSVEEYKSKYINEPITKFSAGGTLTEEEISFITSHMNFIQHNDYGEAYIRGCTKATAIKTVAEYVGIDIKNTIAVGDSQNDTDMINFAGIGVAMGNAEDTLKQSADYITLSVNESGVACALEHLLGI